MRRRQGYRRASSGWVLGHESGEEVKRVLLVCLCEQRVSFLEVFNLTSFTPNPLNADLSTPQGSGNNEVVVDC